ncbi:MAG TPA: hypothetical protein VES20_23380, partial [Bryobacteraceae bacterium]|nr:hypothetical protein [Bryobacteraceae bacterium]
CRGGSFTGCPDANEHNPWTGSSTRKIRVTNVDGVIGIFLKMDYRANITPASAPMVLVTPASETNACEVFSVGSKHEQDGEFGVEIACRQTIPPTLGGTRAPVDNSFQVLVIPRSARTGYALVSAAGTPLVLASRWGALNTQRLGLGSYRAHFRSLAYDWPDGGIALVESRGTGDKACAVSAMNRISAHDVEIDVICRQLSGEAVDAAFVVVATSRH